MTEQLEQIPGAAAAHIVADLHELRRALGALGELVTAADHRANRAERALADALGVLSVVDQRTADVARVQLEHGEQLGQLGELVTELGPVARRAAAMFTSPVGRWAGSEPRPSRRERKGRRKDGDRTE